MPDSPSNAPTLLTQEVFELSFCTTARLGELQTPLLLHEAVEVPPLKDAAATTRRGGEPKVSCQPEVLTTGRPAAAVLFPIVFFTGRPAAACGTASLKQLSPVEAEAI